MKNTLSHFAIYVDELKRAQEFYGNIFEWKFPSYGPADFCQITTSEHEDKVLGALQSRSYTPIDHKMYGMEGTIEVEDIDEVIKKIQQNGGRIILDKSTIPGVGTLIKFLDTEGNLLCAMEKVKN